MWTKWIASGLACDMIGHLSSWYLNLSTFRGHMRISAQKYGYQNVWRSKGVLVRWSPFEGLFEITGRFKFSTYEILYLEKSDFSKKLFLKNFFWDAIIFSQDGHSNKQNINISNLISLGSYKVEPIISLYSQYSIYSFKCFEQKNWSSDKRYDNGRPRCQYLIPVCNWRWLVLIRWSRYGLDRIWYSLYHMTHMV